MPGGAGAAAGGKGVVESVLPHLPWYLRGRMGAGVLGGIGGGLALGPVGAGLGALFGAAPGVATGAGLYGAYKGGKGLGLWGEQDKTRDMSGMLEDRNRVLPFMKNKWMGAAGGALLANMLARENQIEGPMGWLLPILGGMAGHHFLPKLMNKWKDPTGYGENRGY
jgi:hypothetical protein